MRALVLGGTGAIGIHLVQMLEARNFDVFVTSRKEKKSAGKVRYIQGNAQDYGFIESILKENWDVIVDFMIYKTTDFEGRVELLLDATSQYMFLSSARVYDKSDYPINEDSPRLLDRSQDEVFLQTNEYALIKARQEDILKNSSKSNWTIIRPYITYDVYRLQLGVFEKEDWLYRALQGRTIIFSEEMYSRRTTLTHGADVSKALVTLAGDKRALGETYVITSQSTATWGEILNIYLEVIGQYLGKEPRVLLQKTDTFLRYYPEKAKYQILNDRLNNRLFDNSKIAQILKTGDFIPLDIGLRRCLEKFMANPKFLSVNWKRESLKDRHAGELANLREIPGLKNKLTYLIYRYFK